MHVANQFKRGKRRVKGRKNVSVFKVMKRQSKVVASSEREGDQNGGTGDKGAGDHVQPCAFRYWELGYQPHPTTS